MTVNKNNFNLVGCIIYTPVPSKFSGRGIVWQVRVTFPF